jgi:superfamily II DNA/RNA helicase
VVTLLLLLLLLLPCLAALPRLLIPAVSAGHDVLAAAAPGAGSSTAALLAVLGQLLQIPRCVPRNKSLPLAVLVCPSR